MAPSTRNTRPANEQVALPTCCSACPGPDRMSLGVPPPARTTPVCGVANVPAVPLQADPGPRDAALARRIDDLHQPEALETPRLLRAKRT